MTAPETMAMSRLLVHHSNSDGLLGMMTMFLFFVLIHVLLLLQLVLHQHVLLLLQLVLHQHILLLLQLVLHQHILLLLQLVFYQHVLILLQPLLGKVTSNMYPLHLVATDLQHQLRSPMKTWSP